MKNCSFKILYYIRKNNHSHIMKKIVLLLFAVALNVNVFAQNDNSKHHVHRANHRAEHLAKKLNLSSEQRQKVHTLSVNCASKVEATKKKNISDSEKNKEIKLIRTDFKAQMKTILTAEQWNKWGQLKKDAKKKLDNESPDTDELDD